MSSNLENMYNQARRYLVELDSKIEEAKQVGETKQIAPSVLIAEGVRIFGEVRIEGNSSVWFNTVLRGDEGPIIIGENTNIQDCCVLHSDNGSSLIVGNWVSIGHGSVVRGAKIGNYVTIGMNSTVMTGAIISEYCFIGAHSFVPFGKRYPPRTLIYGAPAKVVRELTETEIEGSKLACQIYLKLKEYYRTIKLAHTPESQRFNTSPDSH